MAVVQRTGKEVVQNNLYALLPEGWYPAVITKLESSFFTTKKGLKIEKLVPHVTVLNEAGTRINRQDFIVSYVDDNGLYYNQDSPEKSPFWGGASGATQLMLTLGMLSPMGDAIFDNKAFCDVIVMVKITTKQYEHNGETRDKNFIADWKPVELEDLVGVDGYEDFHQHTVCVTEADTVEDSDFVTLTFRNYDAFEIWYELTPDELTEQGVELVQAIQSADETPEDDNNIPM